MSVSTIFSTDPLGIPVPVSTVTVSPTDPPTSTSSSAPTTTTTSTSAPTTTTSTGNPTTTSDTTTTSAGTGSTTTSNTDTSTSTSTSTGPDTSSSTPTSTAAPTSSLPPTLTSSTNPATSTPTGQSSTILDTTVSNGQTITRTSVVVVPPTITPSDLASHGTSSKGFFHNTGAVAGVFAVVGLAAAAIIVAIVTNAIRRRRAKKLDREIAEAAAEAAHAPAFIDDDYYPDDRLGKAGNGGGDLRSAYSDTTHGTFAQPPMTTGESYNMAELPPFDYGAVAAGAAGAGAAGIGAMGLNRARSMGQNQTTPYNAFAGPPTSLPNPYDNPAGGYGGQRQGGNEMDLLDAAGLAGGAGAGYAAAHQQAYGAPQQQQNNGNLARNTSRSADPAATPLENGAYGVPYPSQGGYEYNPYNPNAVGYNTYQQPAAPQPYPPQPYTAGGPAPVPTQSPPRPVSEVDPYGGYIDEPAPAAGHTSPTPQGGQSQVEPRVPSPGPGRLLSGNFASPPASSEGHEHEEHRMSVQDDEDYGYEPGRRVLRVANE
ncbi:hypothetical protein BD414DRAFT_182340 [Trametes punicea]|nr:hypothetical protein BD414DRAFT_182340 [Trametes punicea]